MVRARGQGGPRGNALLIQIRDGKFKAVACGHLRGESCATLEKRRAAPNANVRFPQSAFRNRKGSFPPQAALAVFGGLLLQRNLHVPNR